MSVLKLVKEKGPYVIIHNRNRCSGCTVCMIVCSFHHFGVLSYDKSRNQVVEDPDNPGVFESIRCSHCEEPVCAAACPVDAITKDEETGWVFIDNLRCIGCRSCNYACPLSNPHFDFETKVSWKCDLCYDKETGTIDPKCVKYCTTGALQLVTREEARKMLKELYGVEVIGGG